MCGQLDGVYAADDVDRGAQAVKTSRRIEVARIKGWFVGDVVTSGLGDVRLYDVGKDQAS